MKRFLTGTTIAAALLLPVFALAAHDDATLTTDTVLSVNGITLNVSGSTAEVESMTVNATNFSVTLSSGSTFQVTAPGLEQINANTTTGQASFICNNSQSLIKYAPDTSVTVTITPIAALCSSTSSGTGSSSTVSSGGGGSSTPVVTTPVVTTTPVATTTTATATVTTTTQTTPAIPASGLSSSQIQSILDVLASFDVDAATMASVKLALEGTTTGSITSAAVHAFKANLTIGSLGSEVKALQEFLNSHGYTIANSGAGSPGNETTKFGALTKAALIKYQKAKGITPSVGYFGPKTREAVNAD